MIAYEAVMAIIALAPVVIEGIIALIVYVFLVGSKVDFFRLLIFN